MRLWCFCGRVIIHQPEAVDRVYEFLVGLNSEFDGLGQNLKSKTDTVLHGGLLRGSIGRRPDVCDE